MHQAACWLKIFAHPILDVRIEPRKSFDSSSFAILCHCPIVFVSRVHALSCQWILMASHGLGTGVYDSDTLAEIDYIPKKMVVQGGGIIGTARPLRDRRPGWWTWLMRHGAQEAGTNMDPIWTHEETSTVYKHMCHFLENQQLNHVPCSIS